MLIVGSKALKFHFPNFKREVKDIDIIGYSDDVNTLCNLLSPTEVKKGKNTVLLKNITNKTDLFDTDNVEVLLADNSVSLRKYMEYDSVSLFASPEVLFSLKKSHIHFPIKFEKHIGDYSFLYKHFKGIDYLDDLTKINFKETELRFGKLKTPSLNKTVKEFFGQSDDYVESEDKPMIEPSSLIKKLF